MLYKKFTHNRIFKRIMCTALTAGMLVTVPLPELSGETGTAPAVAGAASKPTLKLSKKKVDVKVGEIKKIKFKASGKVKAVSDKKNIATASVKKKNIVIKGLKKGTANVKVTCTKTVGGKKSKDKKTKKISAAIKVTVKKKSGPEKSPDVKATTAPGDNTPTPEPTTDPAIIKQAAKELQTFSGPVNSFGMKVFAGLHKDNENTFISPFSIYTAFAMLANGAAGNTYNELANTLGITDLGTLNKLMGTYMSGSMDENVILNIADSLWLGKNLIPAADIDNGFINPLKTYYNSDVMQNVDFGNSKTLELANKWVEEKTNSMIKDLFKQFDPAQVALLINALYFDGKWASPFSEQNTIDDTFYGSTGNTTVKMMTKQNVDSCSYFENDKLKGIKLWYGRNGCYSMNIMLSSDENANTTEVWKNLTEEERLEILNGKQKWDSKKVNNLKFPKFKLGYSDEGKLISVLSDMGMKEVFTTSADLSKIGKEVYVNGVSHTTALEVTEEGSKAAAVTAIHLAAAAAPVRKEEIDFIVNRPFVFVIKDEVSNMVLFIGEVNKL